jgi:hypothetical protein
MKKKENLLILGGNSSNNSAWINKMKTNYSIDYNVEILEYDNWKVNKSVNIETEMEKLMYLVDKRKKYIIIAKSMGIKIAINAIKRNLINTNKVIFIGLPLKFFEKNKINIYDDYQKIKDKINFLFIQQVDDWQCSINELKFYFYDVIIISIKGNNHCYNGIKNIKRYIDEFINLSCEKPLFTSIKASNLKCAIKLIHKNRNKYKYYNNWLSNSDKKILSFKYKGKNYIAKRATINKANIEISNAKILKKKLEFFVSGNYKYEINIPTFIPITKEYCYLISEFYGNDLNQSYYNNTYIFDKEFNKTIKKTISYFFSNGIYYNGFLPRNVILKDRTIILIDFEDINKKSSIAVETTIKIGWSYFFIKPEKKMFSKLEFEDEFSITIKNICISNYSNPYFIALIAESYNYDNYKMDDAINILSPYLNLDIEIALDILLYEINSRNIDKKIKMKIFLLAQTIRIVELVETKKQLKKRIYEELGNIFKLSESIKKDDNFQNYISNIVKINESNIAKIN